MTDEQQTSQEVAVAAFTATMPAASSVRHARVDDTTAQPIQDAATKASA